jgi:hypothetical protein
MWSRQDWLLHRVWGIQRQLHSAGPTGGMADEVRPLDPEGAHQRPRVEPPAARC